MNRIILALLLLSSFLLLGCAELEGLDVDELLQDGDPIYECSISINSSSQECGTSGGYRNHICQIRNASYDIESGIPSFCTNYCLNRSKLLEEYEEECIIVRVKDSSFAIGDSATPNTYWEQLYEGAGDDASAEDCSSVSNGECGDSCGTDEDFDCCVGMGKSWIDGSCQADSSKCLHDSDCPDACSGESIADNYCDIQSHTCKTSKTTACENTSLIAGKTFTETCFDGPICKLDKQELEEHQDELVAEWQKYNSMRQDVTGLIALMDDIMLKQAEGITQELMVTTYEALNVITGSWIQFLGEAGAKVIEDGLSVLASGDDSAMTKGETFAWAYNNRATLRTELDSIDAKLEELSTKVNEATTAVNSLN